MGGAVRRERPPLQFTGNKDLRLPLGLVFSQGSDFLNDLALDALASLFQECLAIELGNLSLKKMSVGASFL